MSKKTPPTEGYNVLWGRAGKFIGELESGKAKRVFGTSAGGRMYLKHMSPSDICLQFAAWLRDNEGG
jgi:hypothetical protein